MALTDFQKASIRQHVHTTDQLIDPATGDTADIGGGVDETDIDAAVAAHAAAADPHPTYSTAAELAAALAAYTPPIVAGQMIAKTVYNPGSNPIATLTAPSTLTDFDATNAKVAFTAPPSGSVLVHVACAINQSGSGADVWLGLRDGSTQVGLTYSSMANSDYTPFHVVFLITGLTPGAAKTYKFAGKASTGNLRLEGGGSAGPLTMWVEASL